MDTWKEVGHALTGLVMLMVAVAGIAAGIGAYLFGIVAPHAGPATSRLFLPSF